MPEPLPTRPPPRSTAWKWRKNTYCVCWRQSKQPQQSKVYVPGYNIPMTQAEHLAALQRQIQYLTEQLHAQEIPAHWQCRAQMAIMAETANVEEAVMASSSPVPPIANEPAMGGEHTGAQSTALANLRSSSATYAEAVMSSAPDVKRSTSTRNSSVN
jgi:hypothetical protein